MMATGRRRKRVSLCFRLIISGTLRLDLGKPEKFSHQPGIQGFEIVALNAI
jgi:hypothetical protein